MTLRLVVLGLCLASISTLPFGRRLNQVPGTRAPPTKPLPPITDIDSNRTCEALKARTAMSRVGRLDVQTNLRSGSACCAACFGVPHSACRSWWRAERGRLRPCYLNSNRP